MSDERERQNDTAVSNGDVGTNDERGFLPSSRMTSLRGRWSDIQAEFVDNPRDSVKDANTMVAAVVKELTETFSRERERLESQWNRDEQPDTETLRVAFQRYRSFFDRLLATSDAGQKARDESEPSVVTT